MEPKFDFSKQEDQEIEMKEARQKIKDLIRRSYFELDKINEVEKFINRYPNLLEEKDIISYAKSGFIDSFRYGPYEQDLKWIKKYFISEDDMDVILEEICKMGQLHKMQEMDEDSIIEIFGCLEDIVPEEYKEDTLTPIENIQNYFLNFQKFDKENKILNSFEELERFKIKDKKIIINKEKKYKNIFENLTNLKDSVWNSEGNDHEIANAFKSGAEVFEYEKMFKFIGTYDRHDALQFFDKIIALQQKSGLRADQFFAQILYQVRKDSSVESGLDAYQKLNNLAQTFDNVDFEEMLQRAQEYRNISSMDKLLNEIQSTEDIFTNWKTLKKFEDIIELLNKSEILDELKKMPEDKKELKEYIEILIFHPNINTTAVLNFWRNTDEFLDIYEEHASRTHELKKPSNYTHIPYLQLDTTDLRDALVERDLDKIQGFSSMEMSFDVPVDTEILNLSIVELTKKALGSFREKIKGEAQNPKKLFSEVQKLFKEQKVNLQDFLLGKEKLDNEISEQLKELLLKSENGLKLKTKEYRAKISDKSDPDAVVAGNDTACCMPFGSGKNNVYTYNPNCGQFVVQEKSGKKWRTIAQSVLTKDINIKMSIPEIVEAASSGHKSMSDIATDDVLENQREVIVCDNVEVTPNIGKSRDALEIIYKEFFKQYLTQNADTYNLEQDKFLVGLGYNDLVFGNGIKNTFLPVAPVGYSDNVGAKVNQVQLTQDANSTVFVNIIKQSEAQKEKRELPKGISELTFADTLKVSYIEGKAYHDNQSLMEYMHNMENGLIAKDIYNAKNDRPNMSLAYTDDSGKMKGYIFAYEGQVNGEDAIYVADLAALPESKMAGGKLISAFLQEYKKQYLDKGDFRSITARAREKTSYKIITKQLNKLGKKIGVKFEMEEIGSEFEGADEMHDIIIRVKL